MVLGALRKTIEELLRSRGDFDVDGDRQPHESRSFAW